jgi:hypothetical protein
MDGSYLTTRMKDSVVSLVDAGLGRQYLVVQFGSQGSDAWTTVVFSKPRHLGRWISEREIENSRSMTPEAAVSGLLFSGTAGRDPIDQLRFDLDYQRTRNAVLRKEIARLTAREAVATRKRGKRGRRDP